MLVRLIAHIVSNALGIIAAGYFVPGFIFSGDYWDILKVALILAAANFVLKPLLKLVSGFFIFITLGFFNIVINMFLLWLVDYYSAELIIQGLTPLFWSTLILSAINIIIYFSAKRK